MSDVEAKHGELKLVFHMVAKNRGSLIELKRLQCKGNPDFSAYCTWFLVSEGEAVKLQFKSWNKETNVREFAQGSLALSKNDDSDALFAGSWTDSQGEFKVEQLTEAPSHAMRVACLKAWPLPAME